MKRHLDSAPGLDTGTRHRDGVPEPSSVRTGLADDLWLWFTCGRGAPMARLDCSGKQRIELGTRHLQLLRMAVDVFGEPVVLFRCPAVLKLGAILALAIEFEVVVIHDVGKFCVTHRILSHDGRDED